MSTLNSRLQLSILNRKRSKNLAEKGFTLIELLISVVILGTLSAVAVPAFVAQKNRADAAAANAQGYALMSACKVALSDQTTVPTTINKQNEKFGNFEWSASVTQTSGNSPTACSSLTTGTTGVKTNQAFAIDVKTGDMSTETRAEAL